MQTLTSEPSALRVPTVESDIHTSTLIYEYISVRVDVCVGIMGSALAEERKKGKPLKSLAEKGISCGQKRIRPLAPY